MDQLAAGFIFGLGLWLALLAVIAVVAAFVMLLLFCSYLSKGSKKIRSDKHAEQKPEPVDLPDGVYFSSVFEER